MKRLFGILLTVMILYAIYYDLSQGTLPVHTATTEKMPLEKATPTQGFPYFEEKVVAGDTVLSILEDRYHHSIPIPISDITTDFRQLNNGLSPQEIQPGKTYKFPIY